LFGVSADAEEHEMLVSEVFLPVDGIFLFPQPERNIKWAEDFLEELEENSDEL